MGKMILKSFGELTPRELLHLVQAREEVFYLEQHITTPDADAVDGRSVFLWVEQEGGVAGLLRIIPPGEVYPQASIGRVLVRRPYRHKGLCREMMLRAMAYVESAWHTRSIKISAQSYLVDFYRTLGFEPVSDEYLEAGIPHRKMLRE